MPVVGAVLSPPGVAAAPAAPCSAPAATSPRPTRSHSSNSTNKGYTRLRAHFKKWIFLSPFRFFLDLPFSSHKHAYIHLLVIILLVNQRVVHYQVVMI